MVVEAARQAMAGANLPTIAAAVRRLVPISHMIQTADTLRYLYLGGRIGKAQTLLGSMLHIKPLIGIEDGEIVPLGKTHSRHQAYAAMAEIAAGIIGKGKARIGYLHAGALQEAQKVKELVEARVQVVESMFGELTPVLAVHTGPGMAGLCYYKVEVSPVAHDAGRQSCTGVGRAPGALSWSPQLRPRHMRASRYGPIHSGCGPPRGGQAMSDPAATHGLWADLHRPAHHSRMRPDFTIIGVPYDGEASAAKGAAAGAGARIRFWSQHTTPFSEDRTRLGGMRMCDLGDIDVKDQRTDFERIRDEIAALPTSPSSWAAIIP